MSNKPAVLPKSGLITSDFTSPRLKAAFGEEINRQVSALTRVLDETDSEGAKVRGDSRLTGRGKSEQARELHQTARKRIFNIYRGHREVQEQHAEALRTLPRRVDSRPRDLDSKLYDPQRRLIEDHRHAEARRYLFASNDRLDITAHIKSAAAEGDRETLIAAEGAPAFIRQRFGLDEVLQEVRPTFLRAFHPEKFEKVELLKEVLDHMESNINVALKKIAGMTGAEPHTLESVIKEHSS